MKRLHDEREDEEADEEPPGAMRFPLHEPGSDSFVLAPRQSARGRTGAIRGRDTDWVVYRGSRAARSSLERGEANGTAL